MFELVGARTSRHSGRNATQAGGRRCGGCVRGKEGQLLCTRSRPSLACARDSRHSGAYPPSLAAYFNLFYYTTILLTAIRLAQWPATLRTSRHSGRSSTQASRCAAASNGRPSRTWGEVVEKYY